MDDALEPSSAYVVVVTEGLDRSAEFSTDTNDSISSGAAARPNLADRALFTIARAVVGSVRSTEVDVTVRGPPPPLPPSPSSPSPGWGASSVITPQGVMRRPAWRNAADFSAA